MLVDRKRLCSVSFSFQRNLLGCLFSTFILPNKRSIEIKTSFTNVFTVCRLVLEWNALGLWDEAFSLFCEGLASNTALTQLDLRNNQINHHGASQLAQALVRNSNLEALGDAKAKCFLSVCLALCALTFTIDCLHRSQVEQHWPARWQVSLRGAAEKQACSASGDGREQHSRRHTPSTW